MAPGVIEVAGTRAERRENVERHCVREGRPFRTGERDALVRKRLCSCEILKEPGEQRCAAQHAGASGRRRARRERKRLLEPFEALTPVAADEPVAPEGCRER